MMRALFARLNAHRLERAAKDCERYARMLHGPQYEPERAYWRQRAQALHVQAIIIRGSTQ